MVTGQQALLATCCLIFFVLLNQLFDQAAAIAIISYLDKTSRADNFSSEEASPVSPVPAKEQAGRPTEQAVLTSGDKPEEQDDFCQRLRDAGLSDVAFILKTGSTEIYKKLPIHLITTFACLNAKEDFLIYSDVAQSFGSFEVHDALALVSNQARADISNFAEYEKLKEQVRLGADAADRKGDKAWDLDKWKFLPMVSDAYSTFRNRKKWFFFIEADTYVSLSNLLLWLSRLDHTQPIYAGAQVLIDDTELAHGGSGLLLSVPAARAFRETYLPNRQRWEQAIAADCCGDKVLADVLMAAVPPIHLVRAFPLIQGETLWSLDWSPTHWCKPAVTWHHVNAAGNDKLWQQDRAFLSRHDYLKPVLFRDYFATFLLPRLHAVNFTLPAWNNLSSDFVFPPTGSAIAFSETDFGTGEYNVAVETAWACRTFWQQTPACVQWAFRKGSCRANKVVRFGWDYGRRPELGSAEERVEAIEGDGVGASVAGWMRERIEDFVARMGECDEGRFWIAEND